MMKSRITKKQNRSWAYIYLGFAFAMFIMALWKGEYLWYFPVVILVLVAGLRLFWMDKKL